MKRIALAIQDPVQSVQDETLMAVLVLGFLDVGLPLPPLVFSLMMILYMSLDKTVLIRPIRHRKTNEPLLTNYCRPSKTRPWDLRAQGLMKPALWH